MSQGMGLSGRPEEERGHHPPSRPRGLGVLGTLVWDRIMARDGWREPVEEWGGLSYALEALSVALPEGWVMRPILKVGEDLLSRALEYLGRSPGSRSHPGVRVVPFQNLRVELNYQDQTRKRERLTGGCSPLELGGTGTPPGRMSMPST